MNLIDATFPYPVLRPGSDDVSYEKCSYAFEVEYDKVNRLFLISVDFEIDNKCLLDLIEVESAVFAVEMKCPGTHIMKRYSQKTSHFEIELSEGYVKGNVDFDLTITAVKQISNYRNPNAHQDFGNTSFLIEPGEVLAYLGTETLETDIKYAKLGAASSFIEVRPLFIDSPYLQVDLTTSIIGICLPEKLYKAYQETWRNPNFPEIFHASIVYNALLYALLQYRDYKDKDLVWVKTIRYYLDNVDALKKLFENDTHSDDEDYCVFDDPDVCQKVAQIILDNPAKRLFGNLEKQQTVMINQPQE